MKIKCSKSALQIPISVLRFQKLNDFLTDAVRFLLEVGAVLNHPKHVPQKFYEWCRNYISHNTAHTTMENNQCFFLFLLFFSPLRYLRRVPRDKLRNYDYILGAFKKETCWNSFEPSDKCRTAIAVSRMLSITARPLFQDR